MNKFDKPMMRTAFVWAEESKCKRSQVGAVISHNNRTISNGYNGTIDGQSNNCEYQYIPCPKCNEELLVDEFIRSDNDIIYNICKCGAKIEFNNSMDLTNAIKLKTNSFTLHAEANAITNAAKEGRSTNGCTIYITKSPCKECSKLIAQSGIIRVVYAEEYKDISGIDFLRDIGIIVDKYEI